MIKKRAIADRIAEVAEDIYDLEEFRDRMCRTATRGDRQWRALAIAYSQRIKRLEDALGEAAAYWASDNRELRERIAARCDKVLRDAGKIEMPT